MARSHHARPSLVCRQCEVSLQPTHNFCPACGTQIRKNCGKCGKAVDPTHKFCGRCGNKLISVIPQLLQEQEDIEKRMRQCDLRIARIQDDANLHLQYLQRLETSKGRAIIADASAARYCLYNK